MYQIVEQKCLGPTLKNCLTLKIIKQHGGESFSADGIVPSRGMSGLMRLRRQAAWQSAGVCFT